LKKCIPRKRLGSAAKAARRSIETELVFVARRRGSSRDSLSINRSFSAGISGTVSTIRSRARAKSDASEKILTPSDTALACSSEIFPRDSPLSAA
jgi:hypothetical protein